MSADPEYFYDEISGDYNALIKRCVPKYDNMLSTLLDYIHGDFAPQKILELGCGTGNLTSLLTRQFPLASITAVDVSGECIHQCKKRNFSGHVNFEKSDFRALEYPDNSMDFVISSISIHHLTDP